ncbi:hypothetical protein, partial [Prevotella histicola]|uniref:hypothetical protein n=1 Tax=Prevotella histicola TaxID=470565 RepID=UPI0028F09A6D
MKTLFVTIMCLCFNVSYAQKPDTTKTSVQAKELDEVVVKASYLTREDDHIREFGIRKGLKKLVISS